MTEYEIYAAIVKDPCFTYSGEPEEWRENIELLFRMASGVGFMQADWAALREGRAQGELNADWATSIVHVDKATLVALTGHGEHLDLDQGAWVERLPHA